MKFNLAFAIIAFSFMLANSNAIADSRSEAISLLSTLKKEGASSKLPDDFRSLDSTVATADMHFHLNDLQNAEKYYLIAIQKALVIQKSLASTHPQPPAAGDTTTKPLPRQTTVENHLPATNTNTVQKHITNNDSAPAGNSSADKTNEITDDAEYLQEITSDSLVGSLGTYTVGKKETLKLIAAKLGVSRVHLASMNRLTLQSHLKEGQELKYNNRRIIPEQRLKEGILINIPDRMLYYFQKGKLVYATAVALGTPGKTGKFVWQTPVGKFRITAREKDPTWTVPPSIQEEMKLEGKEVIKSIPPGPGNPLGKYAMRTSLPGILIHSTSKPWSIYTYASHGCVRVYPQKMEELFKIVKVSTPGEIIYRPVKAAVTDQGKILLEVHGDIYGKTNGLEKEVKTILESMKLTDKVDWSKVKKVISKRTGVAEEITLECVEAQKNGATASSQSPS